MYLQHDLIKWRLGTSDPLIFISSNLAMLSEVSNPFSVKQTLIDQ